MQHPGEGWFRFDNLDEFGTRGHRKSDDDLETGDITFLNSNLAKLTIEIGRNLKNKKIDNYFSVWPIRGA